MSVSMSVEATDGIQEAMTSLKHSYRQRMRDRRSSATFRKTSIRGTTTIPALEMTSSRDMTSSRTRHSSVTSRPGHRDSVVSTRQGHRESVVSSRQGHRESVTSRPTVTSGRDSVTSRQERRDSEDGETPPTSNPMAVVRASVKWRRSSSRSSQEGRYRSELGCRRPRPKTSKPYIKFRRAARAVMLIQRVCRVCKDLVYEAVCSEEWYAKMDSYVESSNSGLGGQPKRVRPFRTLVPNEKKELIQLTFDRSEFFKERRVDLTEDMRSLLTKQTSERTHEQTNEILRFLKRASPDFNSFPLETQRKMVQCMWFDTYMKDRVITKQGSGADSIFFVLSGKLVEKAKDRKQLREIKQGEGFGEEDLKCACPRRTTVLTQTTVDLITIHRQDYRALLNMCDDSHDPRYLDICKQDLVFQHFPLHRLIDNPAVWTVLSYKFGRLMVKDSNEMEWIYIIKSGEARIIKHLAAADFNLMARRKAIEDRRNQESPYFRQKQIVDFVADMNSAQRRRQTSLTSAPAGLTMAQQRRRRIGMVSSIGGRYTSSEFGEGPEATSTPTGGSPGRGASALVGRERARHRRGGSASVMGAKRGEIGSNRLPHFREEDCEGEVSNLRTVSDVSTKVRPHTTMSHGRKAGLTLPSDINGSSQRPTTGGLHLPAAVPSVEIRIEDADNATHGSPPHFAPKIAATPTTINTPSLNTKMTPGVMSAVIPSMETPARGRYMSTSLRSAETDHQGDQETLSVRLPVVGTSGASTPRTLNASSSTGNRTKSAHMVKVPPFVQLEALNPGRVFGLRSCLEPEERGPSASLVSGGCEVLQINKKFFMKHADEAIISLIKLKYKAFPSEEELVDRLDVNIRWEEFKQNTVLDFLRIRGKDPTGYNTAFVSVS